MKALKEKRIRLRSLWRRGLVILSLFALVFASCNSAGDGDDTSTTTPPVEEKKDVVKEIVVTGNLGTQYEGTLIDYSGLKVTATIIDAITGEEREEDVTAKGARLDVQPKYAQGRLGAFEDENGVSSIAWIPCVTYTVTAAYENAPFVGNFGATVVPIVRSTSILPGSNSATLAYGPSWYNELGNGNTSHIYTYYYALGGKQAWETSANTKELAALRQYLDGYVLGGAVQMTGDIDDEVYVDDDYLVNGGLDGRNKKYRLQATYVDGKKKDLPDANLQATIRVHYSEGKSTTGSGDVVISVVPPSREGATFPFASLVGGKSVYMDTTVIDEWYPDSGDTYKLEKGNLSNRANVWFSMIHPLQSVYHVKKIEATGVPDDYTTEENIKKLASINYWDDEGSGTTVAGKKTATALWVDAFKAKGVGLKVTYTNDKTKDISMEDAQKKGLVWWNENPNLGDNTALIKNPDDLEEAFRNTFGVQNVRLSTTPGSKLQSNPNGYAYNKLAGVVGPGGIEGPAVKVNYRGATVYIPVDVWTTYDMWSATYAEGTPLDEDGVLTVTLSPEDNDIPEGAATAEGYGGSVDAEAVFSSARGVTKTQKLTYDPGTTLANWQSGGVVGKYDSSGKLVESPVYMYSMNFGEANTPNPAGVYGGGWGQIATVANRDKVKSVTFYYRAPTPHANSGITRDPKNSKQSLPVLWQGIK